MEGLTFRHATIVEPLPSVYETTIVSRTAWYKTYTLAVIAWCEGHYYQLCAAAATLPTATATTTTTWYIHLVVIAAAAAADVTDSRIMCTRDNDILSSSFPTDGSCSRAVLHAIGGRSATNFAGRNP